ncbi:MAG: hypothetical protein EOO62_19350 [Hymenobacter sp.]|nr:MAG: hypothetical protein EOO62_19350 [Hymenobacter sp.]
MVDRDGYGRYSFTEPLDRAALQARLDFPPTLLFTKDTVRDPRNFVGITHYLDPGPPLTLNV